MGHDIRIGSSAATTTRRFAPVGLAPLIAAVLTGVAGLVLAGPAAAQLPPPPSNTPAQRPAAQPPKPKPP
ncbi:hypothetical protein ABTU92_22860, partial [Rhodoplanes sp. SY1]